MELICNGSLFEEICERKSHKVEFTEDDASKVIRSLLSSISYIHAKNIVHRDIKPRKYGVFNPQTILDH